MGTRAQASSRKLPSMPLHILSHIIWHTTSRKAIHFPCVFACFLPPTLPLQTHLMMQDMHFHSNEKGPPLQANALGAQCTYPTQSRPSAQVRGVLVGSVVLIWELSDCVPVCALTCAHVSALLHWVNCRDLTGVDNTLHWGLGPKTTQATQAGKFCACCI